MTAPEIIRSLDDLRPGDLMFTEIKRPWYVSLLVKLGQLLMGDRVRLGRISVDHVGVVVEAGNVGNWEAHRGDPQRLTYPRLVQAMPSGAEEIELVPSRHWRPGVAYLRLPEDWPGQSADAAAIARLFVKHRVRYSFASYGYLAAYLRGLKAERLAKHINRRGVVVMMDKWSSGPTTPTGPSLLPRTRGGRLPREAICSVLADQAWTLAGKQVMPHGTQAQVVTPGGLFLAIFRKPGVVSGGAGLLESAP